MIGEILTILGAAIFGIACFVGWIKLLLESFTNCFYWDNMGGYISGFFWLGLGILLIGLLFLNFF